MPKQRGPLRLQGKDRTDGKIFYQGKEGKYHVREGQKPGIHKDEPALKANYTTIGQKNRLAGTVSRMLKLFAHKGTESGLYQSLKKKLQKDPVSGRFFQLKRFEDVDGHSDKKMGEEIILPVVSLAIKKDKVVVSFDIESHPKKKRNRDHYFLRFALVAWNRKDDHYTEEVQRIKWIRMDDALPLCYDLPFKKPKEGREYLLICCLERAERPSGSWVMERFIKILKVGSFDPKDEAAYEAYLTERAKPAEPVSYNAGEEKAVGPVVRGEAAKAPDRGKAAKTGGNGKKPVKKKK